MRNIHYKYICETSTLFALIIKILLKCKYIKVLTNVFFLFFQVKEILESSESSS